MGGDSTSVRPSARTSARPPGRPLVRPSARALARPSVRRVIVLHDQGTDLGTDFVVFFIFMFFKPQKPEGIHLRK